jgi:hypothetical protein
MPLMKACAGASPVTELIVVKSCFPLNVNPECNCFASSTKYFRYAANEFGLDFTPKVQSERVS